MGSQRLPGKSAMPILGKPMVQRMIERVSYSRRIGRIVIVTSELPEDDGLAELAARLGVGCFRGHKDDLLARVCAATRKLQPDVVVELLGDNPLVHADLIDDVIDLYTSGRYEYAASVTTEYPHAGFNAKKFPLGIRVQVLSPSVLGQCEQMALGRYYRENSTAYISEHPELFRIGYFQAEGKWKQLHRPELNFAVNYRKNFELVTHIFERCYSGNVNFSLFDVIKVFDSDPSLHQLMGN
jgi:spore coat polysaccharide biosynthesis protein SpsF